MMFSATFPLAARNLAVEYMAHDYAFVRVGRIGSTHRNITQRVRYSISGCCVLYVLIEEIIGCVDRRWR
jgi:superfamily II DNA/RNA helicase